MENRKIKECVQRYEEAKAEGRILYLDVDEFMDIAGHYWTENREEDVHSVLSDALRIHPNDNELLQYQIEFYIDNGKIEKARKLMNSIREPHTADFKYLNAEVFYEEKNEEASVAILNELLEAEDVNHHILINMSELFNEMDMNEKELQCLIKADNMSPNNPDILTPMVLAYMNEGDLEKAISLCNRLIDNDPYSFFPWQKLAECYLASDRPDKAIEAAEFAMIANPQSIEPYVIRIQSYMTLNNYEKALKDLQKVATSEVAPKNFMNCLVGISYFSMNEYSKALEFLCKIEHDGTTERSFYFTAICCIIECFYELGQYKEAKPYVDILQSEMMEVIDTNEDFISLRNIIAQINANI